jgi:hypothetical protein
MAELLQVEAEATSSRHTFAAPPRQSGPSEVEQGFARTQKA